MAPEDPSRFYDEADEAMEREELEAAEARRKRRFLWLVVWLAGAVFAAAGYVVLDKWRTRQARHMAHEATALMSEGRLREAVLHIQSALAMRPDEPVVLRKAAQVLESNDDPQALAFYETLSERNEVNDDDLRQMCLAALRFGRLDSAGETAARLELVGDAGYARLVEAEVLLRRGDGTGALSVLASVPSSSSAFSRARLQTARLLSALPDRRSEALLILRELKSGDGLVAVEAAAAALESGLVPKDEAGAWAAQLESHPAANDRAFLLAQKTKVALDPGARLLVVPQIMARFVGSTPERKMPALRWLNEHGEFARTLELLPARQAVTSTDAFVLWLDALAGTGDWVTADEAISRDGLPLRGALADLFRGRTARMAGRDGAARQHYQRAVQGALLEPRLAGVMVDFLENDRQTESLEDSLWAGLDQPATAGVARQVLFERAARTGSAVELLDFWGRFKENRAGDVGAEIQQLHYRLVLGESGLLPEAQRVAEAFPQDLAALIGHALALLQDGQKEEALKLFDGLSLKSDQMNASQIAVLLAVLSANGKQEQADALAVALDPARLTREELDLVARFQSPPPQP
jgi:thioredoxin-like negative regulator of GroEL